MIEVTRFYDPEEAHVATSFLRAQGIDALLADAHTLGFLPMDRVALGGYRLMAPEGDVARAKRLLEDASSGDTTPEESAEDTGQKVDCCPSCGSTSIRMIRDPRWAIVHALFWTIFPFAPQRGLARCTDCGHKWRKQ